MVHDWDTITTWPLKPAEPKRSETRTKSGSQYEEGRVKENRMGAPHSKGLFEVHGTMVGGVLCVAIAVECCLTIYDEVVRIR